MKSDFLIYLPVLHSQVKTISKETTEASRSLKGSINEIVGFERPCPAFDLLNADSHNGGFASSSCFVVQNVDKNAAAV